MSASRRSERVTACRSAADAVVFVTAAGAALEVAPSATYLGTHSRRNSMSRLFRFSVSVRRDPAIAAWMNEHSGALGSIARHWFDVIRDCGDDVREVLHDGHPTACVADAAFAYVNVFKAHVDVGFFHGAELSDPRGLLEGTGKYMRHVKLRPDRDIDATALGALIASAYADMKRRLGT